MVSLAGDTSIGDGSLDGVLIRQPTQHISNWHGWVIALRWRTTALCTTLHLPLEDMLPTCLIASNSRSSGKWPAAISYASALSISIP